MPLNIGNKTYRNIQEQVLYLSEKYKEFKDALAQLGSVMRYCGSVATYADLPTENNKVGDFYNVLDTGNNYAWDGETWDEISSIVDLSNYVTTNTEQTIPAKKTFTNEVNVFGINFTANSSTYFIKCSLIGMHIKAGGHEIRFEGTARPHSDRLFDLGSSIARWKNLFLSGSINPNTDGYGATFPNTTGWSENKELALKEDIPDVPTNYVTTDTPQTITSVKTFTSTEPFRFANYTVLVVGNNYGYGLSTFAFYPYGNNSKDLGKINNYWKDLYLKGRISDGTNSVNVANIFNGLINYIDGNNIVDNTLTQEDLDKIKNGKPTIVSGSSTFSGMIFPASNSENSVNFVRIRTDGQFSNGYALFSTRKISIISDSFLSSSAGNRISNLKYVNGKEVPSYPANMGTFINKMVNGVLSWVPEWNSYDITNIDDVESSLIAGALYEITVVLDSDPAYALPSGTKEVIVTLTGGATLRASYIDPANGAIVFYHGAQVLQADITALEYR